MPVYEYQCKDCGHIFEAEQRIVDPPIESCGECGGVAERLISRCSFVLKGDGWYVSEYPSSERKKGMEQEKKSNGTSESKAERKTEKASSCCPAQAAA
ncbi:MAG: zinc ribbon domain-containing protein [bacterium]|nr:zinc ribbon domain-containing protein [bacterium]